MPTSEAKLRAVAKYDKENYQHISFKVRHGSRDRIKEAADATNQSINGFIKAAISDAMMKAIGIQLEPTDEETAKMILLRIVKEEVAVMQTHLLGPADRNTRQKIEGKLIEVIESNPSLFKEYSQIISSDLSPKAKGKALRDFERKERDKIKDVIIDLMDDL